MTASYRILISKLDEFIRKYYKNQLVRGALYALSLGLSLYIAIVVAEYYGDFSITLRTILFYSFAGGILFVLGKFVAIPLFKLYRIGDVLSYEDAAQIIGQHFIEVQDKLLNVLQLNKQMTEVGTVALMEAGIEQKIREIKPISFPIAIDVSRNRKYIPYVAIPLFIIILAGIIVPSLLRQGTKEMFQYSTDFPKVAPFDFVIENNDLKAIQQKDFTLKLKIKGDQLPQDVSIQYEGSTFKMEKGSNVAFEYTFRNVQHDETFTFKAAGYESKEYKLVALPEPQLAGFDIILHYPAYIGKKDEALHNTGDLSIPQGTVVQWNFNTNNTDKLQLKFNDSMNILNPSAKDTYTYKKRFMENENYSVSASNQYFTNHDSVKYVIQVIPDLYPSVQVEQKQDSTSSKQLYFNGSIKDDYGFTRLQFIYRIYNSVDSSSTSGQIHRSDISLAKNALQQPFYFYWEMDTLSLEPGQQMEYYFEVWDNDGVNGPKSMRTNPMFFKVPTMSEIVKNTEDNNTHIQNDISKAVQQAYQVQSQMEQERADLFNKQDLNWTDKKKIDNLLQQQLDLQKKAEEIAKQNKQNNQKQWDFQKKDSDLMAKQEELQKLFNQLANDSIKKKLEELQKMMDKLNKNEVQQQLEKLTADNQDFKKELERTLELFKRLDFQQQLKETQERLDSLAQRQEQLSKEDSKDIKGSKDSKDSKNNKEASSQEEQKKQEELNKEFQDVAKSMEDLDKKNSQLEEPTEYKNPEQQSQDVKQDMQNSSQEISKGNSGKASKSQQKASEGMKKMASQMASMEMNMEDQADAADATALRNILNNLVTLSFAQEDLMNRVKSSGQNNMQYADIAHKQKELQDNAATIADSLYALSKKNAKLQNIVNQEMEKINRNMEGAIAQMEERHAPQAASNQQYSMTSINNLALMLSDALNSMQMQAKMKSHSPGAGSCNKPGGMGSKPSMSQLRKMQEQLSKQLDAMKNAMMKQGQNPGQKPGSKQGQKPGSQNQGNSEELAKMAAQQQYIREQMQQAEEEMDANKQGSGQLGDIAQQMSKNEEDIVNQQITDATLQRQQQIIKHLLEYEKAKQTEGQSPDFESHVAKKQFSGNPNPFLEYNNARTKQDELLKTVPPDLNSFYRDKVNQYFNSFQ
jgi:hypothetical protein